MLAKVKKWGNSQGIRIPKHILERASIREGDIVEISADEDKIIIFPQKKSLKKYTIGSLFEGYSGEHGAKEVEWGPPVGKEEW
ncbi:MAG: AbrB/MazE/SpoVT family DNA-binding domain-containing protein [Clostridia bacterium]